MGVMTDDQSLIGDRTTVIEMISDQVPKLIGNQFDRSSNVHRKTGPKSFMCGGKIPPQFIPKLHAGSILLPPMNEVNAPG